MIGLLPFTKVLRYVAISYAVLILGAFLIVSKFSPQTPLETLGIALAGGTALELFLLALIHLLWRPIWRLIPALNLWFFPDLNGKWEIEIDWVRINAKGTTISGKVSGTASVKQSLLSLSMDVWTKNSSSRTLMTQPARVPLSGNPQLHYLYEVTPNAADGAAGSPYKGAAILDFLILEDDGQERLSGNYWTSIMSVGHYRLTRPIAKAAKRRMRKKGGKAAAESGAPGAPVVAEGSASSAPLASDPASWRRRAQKVRFKPSKRPLPPRGGPREGD